MESRSLELRRLPAVHELAAAMPEDALPGPVRTQLARSVLSVAREAVQAGAECPEWDELLAALEREAARWRLKRLAPVINATGVIIHTNLGRAPLGVAAVAAVSEVAGGYSNLEFDLESGRRGRRESHCVELLRSLTGAEDALVVNNNAAAVLLALAALAAGREVVVSRGEMIEIGGSFRIPEVIVQSGCRLREVGATNRTRIDDYRRAVGEETAAILKAHPSNYRIVGFTEAPSREELARLARERGVYFIEDLGSGVLIDTTRYGLAREPAIADVSAAGADIVTCSGDKLLGGPQAGIILGRKEAVAACRSHPLARAVRADKLAIAALQATLECYLEGGEEALPIWRMIALPYSKLEARVEALIGSLSGLPARIRMERGESTVGGGSLPGETLPTALCVVEPETMSVSELAARMRRRRIVGRVASDAYHLDLRTVDEKDDPLIAEALRECLTGRGR